MGVIREPEKRPDARDVAARAMILKHVVVHGLSKPPREMLVKMMKSWPQDDQERFPRDVQWQCMQFWARLGALQSEMSPWEQAFARTTSLDMSDQDQINASWRVEAFQVVLWALKLIPELPPYDMKADHALMKSHARGEPQEFLRTASLRDSAEIDRARNVAELWHWRSRTAIDRGRSVLSQSRLDESKGIQDL